MIINWPERTYQLISGLFNMDRILTWFTHLEDIFFCENNLRWSAWATFHSPQSINSHTSAKPSGLPLLHTVKLVKKWAISLSLHLVKDRSITWVILLLKAIVRGIMLVFFTLNKSPKTWYSVLFLWTYTKILILFFKKTCYFWREKRFKTHFWSQFASNQIFSNHSISGTRSSMF